MAFSRSGSDVDVKASFTSPLPEGCQDHVRTLEKSNVLSCSVLILIFFASRAATPTSARAATIEATRKRVGRAKGVCTEDLDEW
jgi:hypothetical protein